MQEEQYSMHRYWGEPLNIRRADVQGLERNLYRIRANRGLAVMLGKKVGPRTDSER